MKLVDLSFETHKEPHLINDKMTRTSLECKKRTPFYVKRRDTVLDVQDDLHSLMR